MQTLNKKEYPNALFVVKVHLAIELVHMHSTFNDLKETIAGVPGEKP